MRLVGPFQLLNVEFVCNYRAVLSITVGTVRKLKYLSYGSHESIYIRIPRIQLRIRTGAATSPGFDPSILWRSGI
jgi:hypothetical protein